MAQRLAARGIADADALSPRDANAQRMPRAPEIKAKAAATQAKPHKNKEHPPPPPPQVPEPSSADRPDGALYNVGKVLGKGGFAICYEGQHQATKQKYALKIVKSHMVPKMESKFQTELQIHSKMKHKNIVQFFRSFSFDRCTYLILELCPNGSLMDMVKRRKGLSEGEVRFYAVQIAGAIKYMHAKGIIHRDLKMGNIFLDSQMNAKIGDFGLAALLVTGKDMQTIRRTTLCGTPNYIAPEILEKGKSGHDQSVDLWSLGVIVFAMLTSKPPFQSATTDEIYRRARERDYEWPDAETSLRLISEEAKDLVAIMLQDPDQRPGPDQIVQHGFFTSGYMPAESEMSPKLREVPPEKHEFYLNWLDSTTQAMSNKNLRRMCRECCVGPYSQEQVVHAQVWKEMAAEEKAGMTPVIPLSEGIVYRPFDEWAQENLKPKIRYVAPPSAIASEEIGEAGEGAQKAPVGLLRQPPQSFAAQQRAQGRPAAVASSSSRSRAMPVDPALSASQSSRTTRTRKELPREPSARELPIRTSREAKQAEVRQQQPEVHVSIAEPARRPAEKTTSSASTASTSASASSHRRQKSDPSRPASLFGSSEQVDTISNTQPDVVLERLQRLQTELERALNSRSMAIISSKTSAPPHPHVVVKWVDYTNKFGLGYILNDGSVGCVLRSITTTEGSKTATLPPAGVFVRGGERHVLRRQDRSYADRNQPVPMKEPIKFFEDRGESGLSQVLVSPEQFRVTVNEDNTAGKMNPGKDVYQHRKRERIILWKKFANYMVANGRDEAVPVEETDTASAISPGQKGTPSELVTFYQRFGDVGCWAYCDGHLQVQFNFPDHTKIVLDATGTWCHFWHLPKAAAEKLAKEGTIEGSALDERAMLSYPLQTLLNFHSKPTISRSTRTSTTRKRPEIDPELQGIPTANDFRNKIYFIKSVVKEWVANGGLGNSSMSRESRLRWTGYRELVNAQVPQKHVWVTVGARWGDERITTLVDPRRPSDLGEDLDKSGK
ncbi:POLO box duplicated region [Geosmithia morbida]|uniref:POLO box duplicated region n=1 Tax=Geosmithia morbida TaxID=1094350 RepID=A0A9P4YVQ6_9HYPO|nr:POLO box duplicated region [Geosmithia morbida]KAF4122591.1 POLO box duplicated region [Geosmithia morbida]